MPAVLLLVFVVGVAAGGFLVWCVMSGVFDPDPVDQLAKRDRIASVRVLQNDPEVAVLEFRRPT